jgi:hypothetical protein
MDLFTINSILSTVVLRDTDMAAGRARRRNLRQMRGGWGREVMEWGSGSISSMFGGIRAIMVTIGRCGEELPW